jgi:ATP-binding cassette, subfamily B, multidrug efflux pump
VNQSGTNNSAHHDGAHDDGAHDDSAHNDSAHNDSAHNDSAHNNSADDETVNRPLPDRTPGPMARFATMGMPAEKSKDFGASAKRLAARLLPERLRVLSIIATAMASVAFAVAGPKVLGNGTDIIVEGVRDGDIDTARLHRVLFGVVAIYVTSAVLQYCQSYMLSGLVQRTMYSLRSETESKLNRLPLSYVDGQPRGDLLSRATNDMDNISQSLSQTLSQLLTSALTLIGVLVMMFTISPLLSVIAGITIPASLLLTKQIAKRAKGRFIAQWRHTGMLNAQVEEAFTGHAIVKSFGRQGEVEARFAATNDELYVASFGAQFVSGTIQPAMGFLGNINFVAIAVIGGLRVASGSMTIGSVQAFIQYSRQFSQPLTQLASMMNVMQSGVASAERMFELLDAPEQSPDANPPLTVGVPRGRVAFDHVGFSYRPDVALIDDLTLVAEPGQTVAIVGPTGAGKTTLVNLLMRFYDIREGTITLDGVDIASMTRHELRSNMAMVLQDTWLFDGTIRDNIAYGNLDASDDDIRAAAKATYVDRFVRALPDGYNTIVNDEGGALSAGEKQLITIARAFLADPAILILDEATSSVDTRTEVLIQHAMAALRSQRTSFVIAHRLSTIRDADVILVMERGRIVEQGTHDELLEYGGAYFTLFNSQFAGAATEVT